MWRKFCYFAIEAFLLQKQKAKNKSQIYSTTNEISSFNPFLLSFSSLLGANFFV